MVFFPQKRHFSSKMSRISIWALLILFSLLVQSTISADDEVRSALLEFFSQLSKSNRLFDPSFGWNLTSDPCQWNGITCADRTETVKRIFLDNLELDGTFDPGSLCKSPPLADSLTFISLNNNSLHIDDLDDLSDCRQLTHFHANQNHFNGTLPESLPKLNNLKRLDISNNNFSGTLPDLARISGLIEFLVQNNQFSGRIPKFDFSNLLLFNVSDNNFSGLIPDGGNLFNDSSYLNNPRLCGGPLPRKCSSSDMDQENTTKSKNGLSRDRILMYGGYILIALALLILVFLKLCCKKGKKKTAEKDEEVNYKVAAIDDSTYTKPGLISSEYKIAVDKSEVSAVSGESTVVSQSLIVLTSPEVNGLKFEELLKAPAELLGRGKHGSVYKVICEEQGLTFAVKRVKDWSISSSEFKLRMRKLDQVRHPNVLPAFAFYCSRQEKLLVYEYQANGSLFKILHGAQTSQTFDWNSRLGVASAISEALAFMHEELHADGIGHGNIKSSNIFFNNNMDPCLGEYGLMTADNQDSSISASINSSFQANADQAHNAIFKEDVYGLGVIFLELLTGKMPMVQNNGMDLATWVVSVVKEEWTVEVFDRSLIREGASEERMVNLLQIAIKCIDRSPEARPRVSQVATMINAIKEDEERSMDVSES